MSLILTAKEWNGLDLVENGIRMPAGGRHWVMKYGELYDFSEQDEAPQVIEATLLRVAQTNRIPLERYESKKHKSHLLASGNTSEESLISQGLLGEAMKKNGVTTSQIRSMADRDLYATAVKLGQFSALEIAKALPRHIVEQVVCAALGLPVEGAPPEPEFMTLETIKRAHANKLLSALKKIGVIDETDTIGTVGGREKLDALAVDHLTKPTEE